MAITQGSLKIVDLQRIKSRGAFSVTESRILIMRKFTPVVISIAVANPTLYLIAVGLGVGKLINHHSGGVDGVKYLTFLAPALLATAAIQTAMDETVFTTIQGFKWGKVFYAMNATPLSGRQIANGVFLSAFLRTAFSTVIYGVIIDLFGGFSSQRGWLAVLVGLLAGSAFGALMLGISAWIRNDDQFFNILGRFIMMPLFLFSGTFYQLSTLPIYLRWVGWASPIWHATELGRYMTYGHHISFVMFVVHFGYLFAMLSFGLLLAYREFEKRLGE
jgi:lipooligosaccharide transport system permease protein